MTDFNNRPLNSDFGISNSRGQSHESAIKLIDIPSDLGRLYEDITAHHSAKIPNIGDEIADLRSLKRTSAREQIPAGIREAIESPYQRMAQYLRESGEHTSMKEELLRTMAGSLCVLAQRVLSIDGPCLLLLDRDDTIDGRIFSYEAALRETSLEVECLNRCIRPGLTGLLEELPRHKRDLEVGILTARSPERIFDSHSVERSDWLRSLFSENHVYSTALWRVSEESHQMGRQFLAALCDPSSSLFCDVDIDLEPEGLPPDGNPFGKTAAVRRIEREHPDKRIILYDDLEPLPYFLPGQAVLAPSLGVFLEDMFPLGLMQELGLM